MKLNPPTRVDLVEKDRLLSKPVFFWRRERDSNPRGIAPKLISSNSNFLPHRPSPCLKYQYFTTNSAVFQHYIAFLREKCEKTARKGVEI